MALVELALVVVGLIPPLLVVVSLIPAMFAFVELIPALVEAIRFENPWLTLPINCGAMYVECGKRGSHGDEKTKTMRPQRVLA